MQVNLRSSEVPNLTAQYPFDALSIGDYFTVYGRFQHCRVAASEYARKNKQCYSCRMQKADAVTGIRSMRVYRVELNQTPVDQRGRQGKRRIPSRIIQPTKMEFFGWLATFEQGQSFPMPTEYSASFPLMQAWIELFSLKTKQSFRCALQSDGTLLIAKAS